MNSSAISRPRFFEVRSFSAQKLPHLRSKVVLSVLENSSSISFFARRSSVFTPRNILV
jgi:hypothetical protein